MLSPYRVLDLTDHRGQLCGQMLGDLGAEVILVEPPGGSPARRIGPFAGDAADPERSLWFWSYNRGKRSVVADIETAAGQDHIRELAPTIELVPGLPAEAFIQTSERTLLDYLLQPMLMAMEHTFRE